ncbi:LAFA_0G16842g1_1 [Lachancea sp. 'fantastica']|nr:LAFA_0G16842g1_1 [Lachancea sp. 'fantastica']
MADPFANLFSTFKGVEKNERTTDQQVGDNQKKQSAVSERTGSKSPVYTDVDQLLGTLDTRKPQNDSQTVPDELDNAFDVFNSPSPPQLDEPSIESVYQPINSQPPVVDEVKDMEIAKLMSLGMSLEKATSYYDRGMMYDRVVDRLKSQRKSDPRPPDRAPSEEPDLFSLASGWLSKGRTFLDSTFKQTSSPHVTSFSQHISARREPERMQVESHDSFRSKVVEQRFSVSPEEQSLPTFPPMGDNHEHYEASQATSAKQDHDATGPTTQPEEQAENLLDFDFDSSSEPKQSNTTNEVHLSPIELHSYQEFKSKASEAFVAGDYDLSLQNYEKSHNSLPSNHPWQTISLSNMIVSQLKLGQYRPALQNASEALSLVPLHRLDQEIPLLAPVKTFKSMWTKVMLNKAEALEAIEDHKNALLAYQSLIEKGVTSKKVLDGRLRCQKTLDPEKFKAATKSKVKPVHNTERKTSSATPRNDIKTKSAQEKQTNALEDQRFLLHDQVEQRVLAWSKGYENNLRELLARLQMIVDWCDWKEVPSSTLVMPKKVKITYLRAASKTHPDKIQDSWPMERKMIAEHVFTILSKAWEFFKEEHKIS